MFPADIQKETFFTLGDQTPSRYQLLETITRYDKWGMIKFKFSDIIQRAFAKQTGLDLFNDWHDSEAMWRKFDSDEECQLAKKWINEQGGNTVVIRSLLSLCLALDFQMRTGDGKIAGRTETGELVYQAKPKKGQSAWLEENRRAIGVLVNLLSAKIQNTAGYQSAAYIAAVPSSPDKPLDLPTELAKRIAEKTNLHDIGAGFSYASDKLMLKEVSADKKWVELEKSGMAFDRNKGGATNRQKGVILLDDLYQSGATMHYAAMQMQRAGMSRILGLTAVKTMRNDDNQQRDN